MVFLELSMRWSNVNEFSRIKKTFIRYTETNMHHLALSILIDITLITKYHKHWLLTRRHIVQVFCMAYFEMTKCVFYLTEIHNKRLNIKLFTVKNVYTNYCKDASLGINIIAKLDVVSFCQMPLEITTNRYNRKFATISSIYVFIESHVLSEC